jgi:putative nucleotidyltransferase with HDIG domain
VSFNSKFLRSRVARRIFVLFVICALVPIAVLSLLSFIQVSSHLRSQNQRQLQQAAKSLGLSLYERLTILDSEMQVGSLRIQHSEPLSVAADTVHFQRMRVLHENPETDSISPVTAAERAHLLGGKALIRVDSCLTDRGSQCVLMMRKIDPDHPLSGFLVGEAKTEYLWSADRLPADIDLCVLGPKQEVLYSSIPDKISTVWQHNSSGSFEWTSHGKVHDAAYRELFLRPEFFTGNWTVVLSQDQEDAFAPLRRFRDMFFLVTLLAIWIVVLFSLIQIRHTTVPLEQLMEGTKRIAEQDFDARVQLSSRDEFEDLAASFNSMATRLGRQFHTLHAINEIDQAILSSLNRDAVVSTALSRMGKLLPSDCFAIAFFQPDQSGSASVHVALSGLQTDRTPTLTDRVAKPSELQQLQRERSVQILLSSDSVPDYLVPLRTLGMTSVFIFPIQVEQRLFAALLCGHLKCPPMTSEALRHAEQIVDQLAVAFSNVQLVEAMDQLHWGTLTALARAIDAKSAWTAGHSERVTQLALRIGTAMGLSSRDLQVMHRGGLLHDIGKIGVSPQILDKPGKLDAEEMRHMQDHVRIGVRILEPIAAFREALPIVAQHHEWFNGNGYPAGLAGEEITVPARILTVADCFDALVSDRPYRKGLPGVEVVKLINQKSGTQFDPKVVSVLVRLFAEDDALREPKPEPSTVELLT